MDRPILGVTLGSALALATTWSGIAFAQPAAQPPAPGTKAAPAPDAKAPQKATSAPRAPGTTLEASLRKMLSRPGGLKSREVGRRAAATSYDVKAKQKELEGAAADVDKALVGFFPRLTLTARYVRLSPITQPSFGPSQGNLVATTAGEGPLPPGAPLFGVPASAFSFPVILNQYTLQANLTVPLSDYLLRTSQSYASASHSKRAAELSARATRLEAALGGKLTYYAWVRARLQQAVAAQALEQARAHVRVARIAFGAERVSKADVLSAESQLARAELLLARARNMSSMAEDQVRTVMHDTSSKHYRIGENLMAQGRPAPRAFAPLYAEALRKRLEIRALDETAWSLKEQSRVANAGNYPRLDAFGNAYYQNPNPRYIPQAAKWHASWDVGVQLTWTPNDIGTSTAGKRAIDAQRARIEAQKEALKDALRREVMQAYQAARDAQTGARTTERSLAAAEEAYRVRYELFHYGRATSTELLDAETDLLRARLEMINARVDLRTARARLDHATGRDVGGLESR